MSAELRAALERATRGYHMAWSQDMRGHDHPVEDCTDKRFTELVAALASTSTDGVSGTGLDVAWAKLDSEWTGYSGFELPVDETMLVPPPVKEFLRACRAALAKDSPSRA